MSTIIKGDSVEKRLEICRIMHDSAFNDTVKRVITTIKIDERKDKKSTIKSKICQRKIK